MSAPAAPEVVRSATPRFSLALAPGSVEVALHDPDGHVAGRWRAPAGGRIEIDMLGGPRVSVDGENVAPAALEAGFIAWPRHVVDVQGRAYELVCADRQLLARHYSRPQHQAVSYEPPEPNPITETFHLARIAQARRLLAGTSGRVLDVGSGYSLVRMAGPWAFRLVVCDRDHGAMENVRREGSHLPVLGSADELPFGPGSFDAVYAGEIIEHLPEPDAALRSWVALLRHGGRLVLTTPNRSHLLARLSGRERVVNPEHLFEYSRRELVEAVERAGVRVEHVEGLHLPLPVPVPRRGWRDLLVGLHRYRRLPPRLCTLAMAAGRPVPSLAHNLAVVARRP